MQVVAFHVLSFANSLFLSALACALLLRFARRRRIESIASNRLGPGGIPLLGGLGVIIGAICGLVIAGALWRTNPIAAVPLSELLILAGIGIGYAVIGLLDDVRGLSPLVRLLAELAIAALCFYPLLGAVSGVTRVILAGLSAVVIAGGANFVNLTDNLDGLAATTVAISLAAIGLVFTACGFDGAPAACSAAMIGGLGGFLIWNRPPARLYLGDAGSLFLGAVLALWLLALIREHHGIGDLCAAGAMAGYLLFDPIYVIIRRLAGGRAPWVGGTDHPSHDLCRLFGSDLAALATITGIHLVSNALGALVLLDRLPRPLLILPVFFWILMLVAARRGARLANPTAMPRY